MHASTDLIARARRALESTAAAALALAPLALQSAEAAVLDAGDLVIEKSGAYFYNSSGYFSDWNGRPSSDMTALENPDGSTKLYGTASATPGQFLSHNCYTTPDPGCNWYSNRGIAMVWSGSLAAPAVEGDRLAIAVDFTVSIPDVGGSWTFGAQLSDSDFGNTNSLNSYGSGSASGWISDAGTYRIQGVIVTDALQQWQIQPDAPTYWQIYVTNTGNSPWNERYWSTTYGTYVTPYRGLTLTVPDQSIDVAHVDASFDTSAAGLTVSAVPEPSSWLLMALGVGALGAARVRRRH